jgi:hypothetical protein
MMTRIACHSMVAMIATRRVMCSFNTFKSRRFDSVTGSHMTRDRGKTMSKR